MQTPLDPAVKKAYEVSYALFRVAAILPSRNFAELLEKEALSLLRATVGNLSHEAKDTLGIIHYLVAFGKDTSNIHSENAEVLTAELESLASLLHDRERNTVTPADLSQIFSPAEGRVAGHNVAASGNAPKFFPAKEPAKELVKEPAKELAVIAKERQQFILEKIRQSGNCRTRDIQAALPDLSERTLRYDLQRLVEEGIIERGGTGGPASWYKIKELGAKSNV